MPPTFTSEPETFPCLYLDRDQWEQLPSRLEDPFFQALHERNLTTLAGIDESETIDEIREAFRSVEENRIPRRALKGVFQRSLVAWYLTKDEAHLQRARASLASACRSNQWRVRPGQIAGLHAASLETGELLHLVASGFDALYPYLGDAERDECIDALVTKGLSAYLDGVRLRDWWLTCDFNWNSALHGNAGIAGLVVRHRDKALSDRALEAAVEGLPHMIRAFYPGGGYIEGLMYLCTAVGHLTDFVVPYHKFTGDDLGLLSNQALADTFTFLVEMHAGDGGAYNFSDIHESRGGTCLSQIYWWAQQFERPDWTADQDRKFLNRGKHGRGGRREHRRGRSGDDRPRRRWRGGGLFQDIESFWYREPFQEAEPHEPKPLVHFPGIDWLRWRGERTWLAFRSGYNGGNHDNDDLGTFILGIDEERFLCDPGYGAVKASQHNCVTLRRHEQTDGATARIVRLDELPGGFYLECDLREAFPHMLRHYRRHLLMIDGMHLLLLDDILGTRVRIDTRGFFQTRLPVRIEDDGFVVDGQANTLRIHYLSDVDALQVVPWEHGGDLNAMQWDDAWYRVHTVQPILLTFGEPDVDCDLSSERLEVRVDGKAFVFETEDGVLTFRGDQ
jgi:hypothetical protein